MTNSVTLQVPWTGNLSKNRRVGYRGRGGKHSVFVIKAVKDLHDGMVSELQNATGEWFLDKVWLEIFVEMPTTRADAINVVDTIADAVKHGIGVDDKWFAIRKLDWSIKKIDPMVTITVSQDGDRNMSVCYKCSEWFPLTTEYFHRSSDRLTGFKPACIPCERQVAREHKIRKKQRLKDAE